MHFQNFCELVKSRSKCSKKKRFLFWLFFDILLPPEPFLKVCDVFLVAPLLKHPSNNKMAARYQNNGPTKQNDITAEKKVEQLFFS